MRLFPAIFRATQPNFSQVQTAWRRERHSNHRYNSLSRKAPRVRRLRGSCYSKHSPRLRPGQAVIRASGAWCPKRHALVLCVDEKSQIQALDRTQPGLPLKPGRSQTMTHDYKRNGTATLFAALNAANGEVYGFCQERHRHQEWLKFLRLLGRLTKPCRRISSSI
jgi:hypothetical protein